MFCLPCCSDSLSLSPTPPPCCPTEMMAALASTFNGPVSSDIELDHISLLLPSAASGSMKVALFPSFVAVRSVGLQVMISLFFPERFL